MSEDGCLDPYEEPTINLIIETLIGTSFEIKVHLFDSILDIKNKIQRVEGIPVHHQNLLFQMKELKDCNILSDVGIQNGSVLKLVLSMRGGPISTGRFSNTEHQIWKNLKEFIEHSRNELGDKLGSGSKVSVVLFKDGDIINLIQLIENGTDSLYSVGETLPNRSNSNREDCRSSFCTKLKENDEMLTKLTDLRKKMSELTVKRNLRYRKKFEEVLDNYNQEKISESCLIKKLCKKPDSFYDISFKLLEDFEKCEEKCNCDSSINLTDNYLQTDEDSIALKEKHRGNKSKQNFLYSNVNDTPVMPEKNLSKFNQLHSCTKSEDDTILSENKKLNKKLKFRPKTTSAFDEKVKIWSPLSPVIARSRSTRTQDKSVNVSEVPCQINLTPKSSATSISVFEEANVKDKEKEYVNSSVFFPCVGTVSMSKVPVHLVYPKRKNEELKFDGHCEVFSKETEETSCQNLTNREYGLLQRRQSLDCNSSNTDQSLKETKTNFFKPSLFEEVNEDLCFPNVVPIGPSAIPSEYTPREDSLGDFCFGSNQVKYSQCLRSPLYRRYSKMTDENSVKVVKPRNLRHFSWNAELSIENKNNFIINEINVEDNHQKELLKLPTVVTKKKIRCGLCKKRLNITNMYDCRCGGVFCSQHRYSEVHSCKFDYKTEGHKLLQKQNPLIVAEKLQKF